MNPTPSTDPRAALLGRMSQLGAMKRGKLTEQRRPSGKVYHHYQVWEKGRNRTIYVPSDQVEGLRRAIEERQRFEALAESFIDASVAIDDGATEGKKKPSRRSRKS